MGRWDMPDKGTAATAIYSDGKFIGYGAYNQYATILINTHNADCDAYEKRIAELTAELNAAKLIILDDSNSKLAIDRLKAKIPPPFERGDHVWHDAVEIMEDAQLILYPEAFSDDPL